VVVEIDATRTPACGPRLRCSGKDGTSSCRCADHTDGAGHKTSPGEVFLKYGINIHVISLN
jgi:hypothetical protein